jgi:two-component system heavy metal sensor histidine kinase CusS
VIGACSHSISRRLAQKLSLFTMVVLGVLFAFTWMMVKMMLVDRNTQDLAARGDLLSGIVAFEAREGGEAAIVARLRSDAAMRVNTWLEARRADGSLLYTDEGVGAPTLSAHTQTRELVVATPGAAGERVRVRYTVDYADDAALGRRWAWILLLVTLAAGALVWIGAGWHVRRQLRPLRALAAQTRAISPRRLDQRLALDDPAEELKPWVDQFNALMERLERAYRQLEAFNADVAHELRTPLATLMGQTELALSRERPAESLRETMLSNLEEMQRLSALVNDMLFLSQADRGASARRGAPVSLAALAAGVAEFHEATLEEAGVSLRVDGDATVPVDEPLFKRAVSNLIGNATRFAERGSTVVVSIAPEAPEQVRVTVENAGCVIASDHLPKLFDRFFRADASRCCEGEEQHHGLGLAIVAAIARMHAGHPLAESGAGRTRVGFTLATH